MREYDELFEPIPGQEALFPEDDFVWQPTAEELESLERLNALLRRWNERAGDWATGEQLARADFIGDRRVETISGCSEAGIT